MQYNEDKKRLVSSALIFAVIVAILWIVKITEVALNISFARFGILPLQAEGLKGILFSPLIHGSFEHLVSNSVPYFLLGAALFYYYRSKAWQIFILSWLVTGLWVWLFARGRGYHIGASGVVYALASFHFVSGIIRKENRLIAFSLLVTFLYGSFVWGIFPGFSLKERVSWESHLMGAVAGLVLAFGYRDVGPQKKIYEWPEEAEEAEETEAEQEGNQISVNYTQPETGKPEEELGPGSPKQQDDNN
jgi:membrane associated rhomboid family serine protease